MATSVSGKTITIGNCGYTITAMSIEKCRDRATGDTVEITYEVPEDLALASIPSMDSKVDILSSVSLSKAVVTPGTAGITSVKLTYSKPPVEENEDDSGSDAGGGSGSSGDSEGGGGDNGDSPTRTSSYHTSLDITLVDQPILSHPKIAGASGSQLEYLKALLDGARMWELVPVVDNDGKPKTDKKGRVLTRPLGKLLNGGKAVELINKGVTCYKDIMGVFTETYTTRSSKVDTSAVGTINTPSKAPKFKNRNWMLIARNSSLNDDGNSYTVSSTWMLSGLGGWDSDLYGS